MQSRVIVLIVLLVGLVAAVVIATVAGGEEEGAASISTDLSTKPEVPVPEGDPPTELEITDIVEGDGAEAAPGDSVSVQYVGVNHSNGQQFDASWDGGQPFEFELGGGSVIPGWDEGVAGMKVGGRRELVIPPDLGYGAAGPAARHPAERDPGLRHRPGRRPVRPARAAGSNPIAQPRRASGGTATGAERIGAATRRGDDPLEPLRVQLAQHELDPRLAGDPERGRDRDLVGRRVAQSAPGASARSGRRPARARRGGRSHRPGRGATWRSSGAGADPRPAAARGSAGSSTRRVTPTAQPPRSPANSRPGVITSACSSPSISATRNLYGQPAKHPVKRLVSLRPEGTVDVTGPEARCHGIVHSQSSSTVWRRRLSGARRRLRERVGTGRAVRRSRGP